MGSRGIFLPRKNTYAKIWKFAMTNFLPAFEAMIRNEGGYKLHTVAGDTGGMTYAGIARNRWPRWPGWPDIDAGAIPASTMVADFYRENFWDKIRGDNLENQNIARSLFDFAVNAGVGTAVKLAQLVVGQTPDGALGPKTLAAMNAIDPEKFVLAYALAKIARYRDIVTRNRTQQKFLLGWINRALLGVTS
jgi:lysozyme family protein